MKRVVTFIMALVVTTNTLSVEMPNEWLDDSIRTDTFITGSSGMSWGGGIGDLFQNVVKDGMVIGEDIKYMPGSDDSLGTFLIKDVDYHGFTTAATAFSFKNDSLILINHSFKMADLAEVALLLIEVEKVGRACGFKGTQEGPEFSFYWYDRRGDYMTMEARQEDDGYSVSLLMSEASYWAGLLDEVRESN